MTVNGIQCLLSTWCLQTWLYIYPLGCCIVSHLISVLTPWFICYSLLSIIPVVASANELRYDHRNVDLTLHTKMAREISIILVLLSRLDKAMMLWCFVYLVQSCVEQKEAEMLDSEECTKACPLPCWESQFQHAISTSQWPSNSYEVSFLVV